MQAFRMISTPWLLTSQPASMGEPKLRHKKKDRISCSSFILPWVIESMEKKSPDHERARVKKWASSARDWDLARELDSCKQSRDSFQRQIGLLPFNNDNATFDSLTLQNSINQRRIDIIELEMWKRKFG